MDALRLGHVASQMRSVSDALPQASQMQSIADAERHRRVAAIRNRSRFGLGMSESRERSRLSAGPRPAGRRCLRLSTRHPRTGRNGRKAAGSQSRRLADPQAVPGVHERLRLRITVKRSEYDRHAGLRPAGSLGTAWEDGRTSDSSAPRPETQSRKASARTAYDLRRQSDPGRKLGRSPVRPFRSAAQARPEARFHDLARVLLRAAANPVCRFGRRTKGIP